MCSHRKRFCKIMTLRLHTKSIQRWDEMEFLAGRCKSCNARNANHAIWRPSHPSALHKLKVLNFSVCMALCHVGPNRYGIVGVDAAASNWVEKIPTSDILYIYQLKVVVKYL